jgi:Zn-dependent peptidase ImmA (M78 family)
MMARRIDRHAIPSEVQEIVTLTNAANPVDAIRSLARQVLDGYLSVLGGDGPPLNVEALASYRSIRTIAEPPSFSDDAELIPDGDHGVLMRVNRERPLTRQRFSIGHEVGHTLFPGYETQVQCRKPRIQDWHDRKDLVEYLCDVASSEFLFPLDWFQADIDVEAVSAARLVTLAGNYKASPKATVRRYIDLTPEPTAAIFFRWQLKPTEQTRTPLGRKTVTARTVRRPVRKLRVEYGVWNEAFEALGLHIPAWKSIDEASVIHRASSTSECLDAAREHVDLGAFTGWFRISALPLFTQEEDQGPAGENGVIAILQQGPTRRTRSKVAS